MINPVYLRSFCTLVEVEHFTRTAERLHMTQSGVSQHIHKLEEQLGRPLLIRQGKRFTLTDAGELLYKEAREIILSLSNLEQRVKEDHAFEGVVRIMLPGSVGLKLYPHLLYLQQQHPKLVIDYRFAPNSDIEKAISNNDIDIGFMTSPSNHADVNINAVAEEELLLVTPGNFLTPDWEQLLELGFIDHPDGAYHAGLLLGANYPEFQHSNQFKKKGFSNQISLILEPVSRGFGFTVLPAFAVENFQNTLQNSLKNTIQKSQLIKTHRLSNPISETLYLGTNRSKSLPNRVNTVIEEAKKWL
ncbi:LysR family transcriptional regulator [Cocleimonas flava]|uniref:LysR family transcriptional regulator n=1 Tax=Cocleimonas flava TaxID=634765 RepID=A0A4R1FCL7_9GAMM|nr:LysR family transcriptional regulator [Cocleimonas flava]TCJ88531.1 LysR family transcriptional regulator [Cocleimonas flava]